ncbi:MAG: hypothetical protein ACRC4T_22710 [Cetobacterium sp.]
MQNISRYFKEEFKVDILCLYPFLSYIGQIIKVNLNNIFLLSLIFFILKKREKIIGKTILLIISIYTFLLFGNYLLNFNLINNKYFLEDSKYLVVISLFLIFNNLFLKFKNFSRIENNLFYLNTLFNVFITVIYTFGYHSDRILFIQGIEKISPILVNSFVFHYGRIFSGTSTYIYALVSLLLILELLKNGKIYIFKNLVILFYSIYFSSIINFLGVLIYILIYILAKQKAKIRIYIYILSCIFLTIGIFYIEKNFSKLLDGSLEFRIYQSKFLWEEFLKFPYFGKGFGGYVSLNGVIGNLKPYLYEMDLLSLLMKLGLVGFFIYLQPIFILFMICLYKKNELYVMFFMYLIIFFLSNGGFFSSTLFSYGFSLILTFITKSTKEKLLDN